MCKLDLWLIREEDILGQNNAKYYEVIDPKVEYLVKRACSQNRVVLF